MTHPTATHTSAIGTTFALAAAALLPTLAAAQAEDAFDRTPVDCIAVTSIDRTDVIDDRTILFYMRGKQIFRNYLPKNCPGLEREDRFSYQVRSGRLCDIDTITVLEQWGSRFSDGFTCSLGEFLPIPAEEVDELLLDEDGNRKNRNAIEVEKGELPADDEKGEASDDADAADESPQDDAAR